MARVYSPLAGKLRGRVGSTIFRNGQNATVAAQYNPQVANPKTAAQAVQRAAFATATTAQAAMLDVVDHSHEKLSGRRANLQRFVQQNTDMVRAGILADYNGGFTNVFPTIKGARSINIAPYIVSEGSLLFPRTQFFDTGSVELAGFKAQSTPVTQISTQDEYVQALAAIGLLPGDQISLVGIIEDTDTKVASVTIDGFEYPQFACEVQKARVTFVSTIPEGFNGPLILNDYFNPALVAKSEGAMIVQFAAVEGEQTFMATFPAATGDYILAAAVLIRSQETSSKVLYSNGRMAVAAETESDVAWPRAQSYMEGASVQLGDQPFLDNPLQAPSVGAAAGDAQSIVVPNFPFAIAAGDVYPVEVPLPAEPSELRLTFIQNGDSVQSGNIVGASAGTVLTPGDLDETLVVSTAGVYNDGSYDFAIGNLAGGTATSVVSGFAIVNGQRYTF